MYRQMINNVALSQVALTWITRFSSFPCTLTEFGEFHSSPPFNFIDEDLSMECDVDDHLADVREKLLEVKFKQLSSEEFVADGKRWLIIYR